MSFSSQSIINVEVLYLNISNLRFGNIIDKLNGFSVVCPMSWIERDTETVGQITWKTVVAPTLQEREFTACLSKRPQLRPMSMSNTNEVS